MEAMVERCCGLDVHKEKVVACLLVGAPGRKPTKEMRTFKTYKKEIEKLAQWLAEAGCTQVGMESTGSYWVPIYRVLEESGTFELVLGNAQHIKNVPGRKTDMKDSQWLAELLRHGLVRKSFVPPKPIRELRDLLRYRRGLVDARSTERNRLHKLLETAHVKLASVASDIFGVSGMLMLKALGSGTQSPAEMAEHAKRRMRSKIPELTLALDGSMEEHHRYLLKMQLDRLQQADDSLSELDRRIDEKLEPYREQHNRLTAIPGVDWWVAAVIIAELGADMTVFPSKRHVSAWAGVCPGNNESAGKNLGAVTRKGNVHLKTALVEAAIAASRSKGTYAGNKFFRLKARRGFKRAAMAIAHKTLIAAYHILQGQTFIELGAQYLDKLNQARTTKQMVNRLEQLGYSVALTPVPTA